MLPIKFDYAAPENLAAATKLLHENQQARILAGGHSLLTAIKSDLISPSLLIDLKKIPNLQDIKLPQETGGILQIGGMTTYDQVATSSEVQKNYQALAEAANSIGDPQIRNWGRMGDIFAYRDLACDLLAVALVLEATFHLTSANNSRVITADDFISLGIQTQWQTPEILTSINFPAPISRSGSAYEFLKHPASGYVICGIAVLVELSANDVVDRCSVAVTGATSYPLRLSQLAHRMQGKAPTPKNIATAANLARESITTAQVSNQELTIVADRYASSEYRHHMIGVFTQRALTHALKQTQIP
jgi:carbon-monoxide dehydrogenase medium subunit